MKRLWISVLAIAMMSTPALAECPLEPIAASAQTMEMPEGGEPSVLFVQSSEGLEVTEETITLVKPSPETTWVKDWPERKVGQESNQSFATFWDEWDEGDSFADNPPNAAVTVAGHHPVIVVLTDITVGANTITYDYELLSGSFPSESSPTTIVIDGILCYYYDG